MVKLLALDLDGTTLNSKGKITIPNKEALNKWTSVGNLCMFATGQPFNSALEHSKSVGYGCNFLTAAGGTIVARRMKHNLQWKIQNELSSFMTGKFIANIARELRTVYNDENNDMFEYWIDFGDSSAYSSPKFHTFNSDLASIGDNSRNTPNKERCIYLIEKCFEEETKVLGKPREEVAQVFILKRGVKSTTFLPMVENIIKQIGLENEIDAGLGGLDSRDLSEGCVNLKRKGTSKAKTILKVLDILKHENNINNNSNNNVNEIDCIAIGDGSNDAEMLKNANISICVNNAIPMIKNLVQYVLPKTNDEHAIAYFINDYLTNDMKYQQQGNNKSKL